jgi:hypothetical protein
VCSEEEKEKVVALGLIKVDVMNRAPMELDVDQWSVSPFYVASHVRTFIDVVSLITWTQRDNPNFDLGTLPYNVFSPHGFYGAGTNSSQLRDAIQIRWPMVIWVSKLAGERKHTKQDVENSAMNLTVIMPFTGLDITKANDLKPEATEGYVLFTLKDRDTGSSVKQAAIRVCEDLLFSMIGLVGPATALQNYIDGYRKQYLSVSDQAGSLGGSSGVMCGPYNKCAVWRRPSPRPGRRTVMIIPGSEMEENVSWSMDDTRQTQTLARRLSVYTFVQDRACQAFIIQESNRAIACGEHILRAIFAAHVAAQYLELGLLTRRDVLHGYCTCLNTTEQALTEHLCATCHSIRPCILWRFM